jgi:hypothetical protein
VDGSVSDMDNYVAKPAGNAVKEVFSDHKIPDLPISDDLQEASNA